MFVRDIMTRNPITLRPESDPLAAIGLMNVAGFRHLPVLDTEGRLVGIVGRTDVELFLSKAGSPGVIKRNHRVDRLMKRDVVFVTPDCPLEEAATLMVNNKIGSLPVVEDGCLVGIITETDVFKRFAAILGGGTDSFRLTVQLDNIPGQFAELATRIARVNGNISCVVTYPTDQPGRINTMLRVEGVDRQTVLAVLGDLPGLEVLYPFSCG